MKQLNSSEPQVYECMDSSPGNLLTITNLLLNALLWPPLTVWMLRLQLRHARLSSRDFVLMNQSVSELVTSVALALFVLGVCVEAEPLVLLSIYLSSAYVVGRPLFQSVFCVERYLAVVHPLLYRAYSRSARLKLPAVALVWALILAVGGGITCSYPKMPLWISLEVYVAALLVCAGCSAGILWVLRRRGPLRAHRRGRRAFRAVTVILGTFLLGYGTLTCVILLRGHFSYRDYCVFMGLGWWSLLPSSAVQPYLYLTKAHRSDPAPRR